MLPQILPSPLTSLKEPIGHPNWIYELKHDGFRGSLCRSRLGLAGVAQGEEVPLV